MNIFWWRGEYSADDNAVRIELLEHSLQHQHNEVDQKYCKLRT